MIGVAGVEEVVGVGEATTGEGEDGGVGTEGGGADDDDQLPGVLFYESRCVAVRIASVHHGISVLCVCATAFLLHTTLPSCTLTCLRSSGVLYFSLCAVCK